MRENTHGSTTDDSSARTRARGTGKGLRRTAVALLAALAVLAGGAAVVGNPAAPATDVNAAASAGDDAAPDDVALLRTIFGATWS